ncbi:SCO2322 family protein [Thalassiella azotivora]
MSAPSHPRRRVVRGRRLVPALLAAALGGAALAGGAAPAVAAPAGEGYRFWGYFQQDGGEWQFAQTGPDASVPADGAVEGWRFATAGLDDTRYPRATPGFEEVCGGVEAEDGSKRVAVVLDYGRVADADGDDEPPAARADCAVVPGDATGAEVVATVAQVRAEGGMVCGVDGWPASGCGEPVSPLPAAATEPDEPVELALPGDAATGDATDEETTSTDDAGDAAGADAEEGGDEASDGSGSTVTWVVLGVVALVAVAVAVAVARRRGAED